MTPPGDGDAGTEIGPKLGHYQHLAATGSTVGNSLVGSGASIDSVAPQQTALAPARMRTVVSLVQEGDRTAPVQTDEIKARAELEQRATESYMCPVCPRLSLTGSANVAAYDLLGLSRHFSQHLAAQQRHDDSLRFLGQLETFARGTIVADGLQSLLVLVETGVRHSWEGFALERRAAAIAETDGTLLYGTTADAAARKLVNEEEFMRIRGLDCPEGIARVHLEETELRSYLTMVRDVGAATLRYAALEARYGNESPVNDEVEDHLRLASVVDEHPEDPDDITASAYAALPGGRQEVTRGPSGAPIRRGVFVMDLRAVGFGGIGGGVGVKSQGPQSPRRRDSAADAHIALMRSASRGSFSFHGETPPAGGDKTPGSTAPPPGSPTRRLFPGGSQRPASAPRQAATGSPPGAPRPPPGNQPSTAPRPTRPGYLDASLSSQLSELEHTERIALGHLEAQSLGNVVQWRRDMRRLFQQRLKPVPVEGGDGADGMAASAEFSASGTRRAQPPAQAASRRDSAYRGGRAAGIKAPTNPREFVDAEGRKLRWPVPEDATFHEAAAATESYHRFGIEDARRFEWALICRQLHLWVQTTKHAEEAASPKERRRLPPLISIADSSSRADVAAPPNALYGTQQPKATRSGPSSPTTRRATVNSRDRPPPNAKTTEAIRAMRDAPVPPPREYLYLALQDAHEEHAAMQAALLARQQAFADELARVEREMKEADADVEETETLLAGGTFPRPAATSAPLNPAFAASARYRPQSGGPGGRPAQQQRQHRDSLPQLPRSRPTSAKQPEWSSAPTVLDGSPTLTTSGLDTLGGAQTATKPRPKPARPVLSMYGSAVPNPKAQPSSQTPRARRSASGRRL